ncbi:hypothetical protein, partial [Falsarthrobacter nasiphocae]
MRELRLKGQIKLHWSDESASRRRKIVHAVAELEPITMLVAHLSDPAKKTERFRRLCLERIYSELHAMKVCRATLETRTDSQDKRDVAHLVSLQNKGVFQGLRIEHKRGGDEPLLWIADTLLGAFNARKRDGDSSYWSILEKTLDTNVVTAQSKSASGGGLAAKKCVWQGPASQSA